MNDIRVPEGAVTGLLDTRAGMLLSRSYLAMTGGQPKALIVDRFAAHLFT